jgi:hypothetical protein
MTTSCQCCGGSLPDLSIWEANREIAGECDGTIHLETGRCRAYADDETWCDRRRDMTTYKISTDACSTEIAAESMDAAAAEFAASEGIKAGSARELAAAIRKIDGAWLYITVDGEDSLMAGVIPGMQ